MTVRDIFCILVILWIIALLVLGVKIMYRETKDRLKKDCPRLGELAALAKAYNYLIKAEQGLKKEWGLAFFFHDQTNTFSPALQESKEDEDRYGIIMAIMQTKAKVNHSMEKIMEECKNDAEF